MKLRSLKIRLGRRLWKEIHKLIRKLNLSFHGAWLLATVMVGFEIGIALVGLFVQLIPILK